MTRAQQIASLYRQGKGQREIAREVGISQPAVRKWLIKLGLLTPLIPPPGVQQAGGDNPPSPSPTGGDNHPAVPPKLPEQPPAENSTLAQRRRRVLQLPVSPQISCCHHCGANFRARLLDDFCCWGCYRHSVGAASAPQRHSAECRRVPPDNLNMST